MTMNNVPRDAPPLITPPRNKRGGVIAQGDGEREVVTIIV